MADTSMVPAVVQSGDGNVFQFPTPDDARKFELEVKAAGGETARLVPRKSFFELESDLDSLLECLETVEPEQQEEWLADFSAALQAAKDKRDRLNWFMCLMEACIVAGEAEKKRLDKRSARCTAALERLNLVVTRVIKERGQDADGRWIKLEGNNVTFKLANNPPSVAVTDEAAVPTEFKTVTVTLPAPLWEEVCDSLDLDLRDRVLESVKRPDSKVAKTAVKEAIAASIPNWKERLKEEPAVFCDEVPGASIKAGGTRLVRE